MTTVGDVGFVDDDGYVHLTDRATFMIISGGVNVYPQECENLLISHPKVCRRGRVRRAQPRPRRRGQGGGAARCRGSRRTRTLAAELIAYCRQHLAGIKCPRTVDFEAELPRLPTGKLYKRILRDRYWADRKSRIV